MLGDFPLWLAGLLFLQFVIIAVLMIDSGLTQRRLNQDERLLERLILGNPDKRLLDRLILGNAGESKRAMWWRRILRRTNSQAY